MQRRTTCKIQNGCQGAPKWPTGSGKASTPRFLGTLTNFFNPSTPSMRKGRDGGGKKTGEKKGRGKEKIMMKIVATTSLPAAAGTPHACANYFFHLCMSKVNSGKTAGSFHSECPQNHVISNQIFASTASTTCSFFGSAGESSQTRKYLFSSVLCMVLCLKMCQRSLNLKSSHS